MADEQTSVIEPGQYTEPPMDVMSDTPGSGQVRDVSGMPIQSPLDQGVKDRILAGRKANPPPPEQHSWDAFKTDFAHGFGSSTASLLSSAPPDDIPPEHADMFYDIASQVGTTAGDVPAMLIGGIGGAAAGVVAGGVAGAAGGLGGAMAGAVAGGELGFAAGGFALPAAMRSWMLDHYKNGDMKTFGDFWARASAAFIEGSKGAATGAMTELTGGAAGRIMNKYVGAGFTSAVAAEISKIAAMTGVGKALEGQMPEWKDFAEGAVIVGGLHVAGVGAKSVVGKLGDIWVQTGLHPKEVAQESARDPVLKEEMLSENKGIPERYKSQIDPDFAKNGVDVNPAFPGEGKTGEMKGPPSVEKLTDGPLLPGLSKEFTPEDSGLEVHNPLENTKVVNKEGKPKVVYHGTSRAYDEMNPARGGSMGPGFYFTENPDEAAAFSSTFKSEADMGEGTNVRPANLDIKNPLEIDSKMDGEQGAKLAKILDDKGYPTRYEKYPASFTYRMMLHDSKIPNSKWPEVLKEAGYDGIHADFGDKVYKGRDQWLAFDKEQVHTPWMVEPGSHTEPPVEITAGKEEPTPSTAGALENVSAPGGEEVPSVQSRISGIPEAEPEGSLDRFMRQTFDDLHQVEEEEKRLMGNGKSPVMKSFSKLLRLSRSAPLKAQEFIDGLGPRNAITGQLTGTPSLKKILSPIWGKREEFTNYMAAAHALELEEQGIKTGVPLDGKDGARATVEKGRTKFDKSAKQFVQWQNDVLAYAKDSGLISEDQYNQNVADYKYYVPFQRLMDEGRQGVSGAWNGLLPKNPIKAIEGSTRKILDPFEQAIKKTFTTIENAERNQAMQVMADTAELYGEEGKQLLEKIPAEERPFGRPIAPNEVEVWRNGERSVYKSDPDVVKALKGATPQEAHIVTSVLKMSARLERSGVLGSVSFMENHFSRAMMGSWLLSENQVLPLLRPMQGLVHVLLGTDKYHEALFAGALNDSLGKIDKNYVDQNVWQLSKKTGVLDNARNVLSKFIHIPWTLAHAIAKAAPMGEYLSSTSGKPLSRESMAKGAIDAKSVDLDMTRKGDNSLIRFLTSTTAFLPAKMQALEKTFQSIKNRPLPFLTKSLLGITLPSLYLWNKNKDEEWYKDSAPYLKALYWQFKIDKWEQASPIEKQQFPIDTADHKYNMLREGPNGTEVNHGTVYKMWKPFLPGLVMGSLPEMFFNSLYNKDKAAFGEFAKNLLGEIPMSMTSTFSQPIVEHMTDHSFFRGRSLVPAHYEGINPPQQYTEYTSDVAKNLGKILGNTPGLGELGPENAKLSSPIVVDNYLKQWFGGFGQYAIALADRALQKSGVTPTSLQKQNPMSDNPFTRAFTIKYPSQNSSAVSQFMDRTKLIDRNDRTVNFQEKGFDIPGAMATKLTGIEEGKISNLSGVRTFIQQMTHLNQLVEMNKDIPDSDKVARIDADYFRMIGAAIRGNEILDELEKRGKQMTPELDAKKAALLQMTQNPLPENPPGPQMPQAPTPSKPQPIRHLKTGNFNTPIPGTDAGWENPAMAPTNPKKGTGE